MESLWIEPLLPKTKPIVIGTIYRPPKMSDFIDKFGNVLCQLKSDTETIILGDFNICMKKNNNSLGVSFTNIMQLFGFEQIINEPTRVTEKLFFDN